MNVAAIIVTRGDQDLTPILTSLPDEWAVLVWDNGARVVHGRPHSAQIAFTSDLSVYGRYAAIEHTDAELIYVQDDDCVVSAPLDLESEWLEHAALLRTLGKPWDQHVVCNMPPEFRHDFYTEHALVGFGAVFHRDAPGRAWMKMVESGRQDFIRPDNGFFYRTCDIVFTALTPRVLVDVPKSDLSWAHDDDRMWKQPTHQAERARMLDLVKQVRNREE